MTRGKKHISLKIISLESLGFSLIAVLLWADEFLDLPHRLFGAPATPVNWQESLFETVFILVLAVLVLGVTWRFIMRIEYLEGFLPICSFCKRIRVDEDWVPLEEFISSKSSAEFTHSLCPECAEEHYGDLIKRRKGSQSQQVIQ